MAECKEGKLGRSQIIKCLAGHDKKIRGHQEATGRLFGCDVIYLRGRERHAHYCHCSYREAQARKG